MTLGALRRVFDWFLAPGASRAPRSAPVVHYGFGSDFGQPIGPSDYQAPREFSFSFGIRY